MDLGPNGYPRPDRNLDDAGRRSSALRAPTWSPSNFAVRNGTPGLGLGQEHNALPRWHTTQPAHLLGTVASLADDPRVLMPESRL